MLSESLEDGTTHEWIGRFLPAGTYYVRVQTLEAGENAYVLRYGVTTIATEAEDLGVLATADGLTVLSDTLDGVDTEVLTYYSFTLEEALEVGIGLRQLDYAADLFIEDANAQVLYESVEDGTTNEWIGQTLAAGTYYVRVETLEAGENAYVLRYGVMAATQ